MCSPTFHESEYVIEASRSSEMMTIRASGLRSYGGTVTDATNGPSAAPPVGVAPPPPASASAPVSRMRFVEPLKSISSSISLKPALST